MQQLVHQPFVKPASWAHPFPPLAQTQCITYKLQVGAISREESTLSPELTSSFRSSLGKAAGRIHSAERVMGKKHSVAPKNHHLLIFPHVKQMRVTKVNLSISGERLIQWRQKDPGRTAQAQ